MKCPSGSYDRGLWQLNSTHQAAVTNACAFRAQCNANAAYRISDAGLDFAPWAVYGSVAYARYLGAAQAAVAGLGAGSVTSAVFGVCLARSRDRVGASVVIGDCGAGGGCRLVGGGRGPGGSLLSSPRAMAVIVARCTGTRAQTWWLP